MGGYGLFSLPTPDTCPRDPSHLRDTLCFMAFQHRPLTGSPPPIPMDLQNLQARRHRVASETPKLLLFVTTVLAVAGLWRMGLSLRSFQITRQGGIVGRNINSERKEIRA